MQNTISTPCYIFDEKKLDDHMTRIQSITGKAGDGIKLCYAVKANTFLIPLMDKYVSAFEVCSWGELKICIKYGINPDKIILSGVNKESGFVQEAIDYGVTVYTAESLLQYDKIAEASERGDKKIKIFPRLSNGAQFGMPEEDILTLISRASCSPNITVAGIHYFTGTQKKKISKIEEELELVLGLSRSLSHNSEFSHEWIEYGPGLWVPYFTADDFDTRYDMLALLTDYIISMDSRSPVMLEMGRFMAAPCGELVTSVADIKGDPEHPALILDSGRNHISYYGQNMVMKTPIIEAERQEDKTHKVTPCDLYGSLCSFNDMLARAVPIPRPEVGDRLIFREIGAYSVTEGIYLFLSRDMPEVYIRETDGTLRLIRERRDSWSINS